MKAKEVLSRQDSIVQWQSVEVGIFSVEPAEPGAGGTRDPAPLIFFSKCQYVPEENLFLQKAFYFLVPPPPPHIFKYSSGPAPSAPRARFGSASRP